MKISKNLDQTQIKLTAGYKKQLPGQTFFTALTRSRNKNQMHSFFGAAVALTASGVLINSA